MDADTLRAYRDRRIAAAMAYMKLRNVAPVDVVDAAYAEYDEAHALWQLAQQAYDAASREAGEEHGS